MISGRWQRVPLRARITLLAAGMAAQAAAFLEKANWLTTMSNVVWDTSWLLEESSIPGKALHTLIGYTDQPTAMQLVVYVAVLAITFVLMRFSASQTQSNADLVGRISDSRPR